MNATKERTCEDRVEASRDSRLADLRKLWELYCDGDEDGDEETGNLWEYGLSFDYVVPETFTDQDEGFWRYQISCGGPQEEIRFYASLTPGKCADWCEHCTPYDKPSPHPMTAHLYRAEFWFLDWFDGASRDVTNEDTVRDLWEWFNECGSVESTFNEG